MWSRAKSVTAAPSAAESNLLQPDGKRLAGFKFEPSTAEGLIEFGRIAIEVSPDGRASHNYNPDRVSVTDEEVIISLQLVAPSALTLYAVHRTRIESHEADVNTTLIPMQPNKQRSYPVTGGQTNTPLPSPPLDFTCTEIDASMSNGPVTVTAHFSHPINPTTAAPHPHPQAHAPT